MNNATYVGYDHRFLTDLIAVTEHYCAGSLADEDANRHVMSCETLLLPLDPNEGHEREWCEAATWLIENLRSLVAKKPCGSVVEAISFARSLLPDMNVDIHRDLQGRRHDS